MTADQLKEWLEDWVEVPPTWQIANGQVVLFVGSDQNSFQLSTRHVAALRRGTWPRIKQLTRVPHCGIELPGYAEYLLTVDKLGGWPTDEPLRFRVGDTLVSVGRISPALALLCEMIYRSSDYSQKEFFESYHSMQIERSPSPQEDASLALFYLNSDYLRPLKASARILHLLDPSEAYPFLESSGDASLVRRRIRTRKRIHSIPPVLLFNEAATEYGEARFLGFYRVLEFYFWRGAVRDFGEMRKDPAIADDELLTRSRHQGELPQLRALIRTALTPSELRSLIGFAGRRNLGTITNSDELAKRLYDFRNNVVHAKEPQIASAHVPRPFDPESNSGAWSWIAEALAERSIRRL